MLLFLSALVWSFGGTIARFIEQADPWTVVFWRSGWATLALIAFMVWRDGWRGTIAMFRDMGFAGLIVAGCFAIAATCFVIALGYTTVANVVLIQAGVPLIAALISWLVFRETVGVATWIAIVAVIGGVAFMVSDSFGADPGSGGNSLSYIGDGLAVLIACAFATATVITRRYSHVRMTPANCLGVFISTCVAATLASTFSVATLDMGLLFVFGALNLGFGLALFALGARMIPAAFAALIGTFEPVLAPVWVWLIHGEIPSDRTLIGGAVVVAALLTHILLQFRRPLAPAKPGTTGIPSPP
ncbi:MAG: DMT family transporter [Rhizobiaceae bacterium]